MAVGFYVRTCTYMYDTIELIQLTYRNVLYIPSQDTIEARLTTILKGIILFDPHVLQYA